MARFDGPGDPFVVANPRASRLQDADRRARVLDDVRRAVEAATGRTPRIVVEVDLTVAEAALDEAAADGAAMIAVIGGDGTVRDAATLLAGTEIPLATLSENIRSNTLCYCALRNLVMAISYTSI